MLRQRAVTKTGKNFTRFSIKNILQNPVYLMADGDAWQYFVDRQAELFSERSAFDGTRGILAYNRTDQEKGRAAILLPVNEWIVTVGQHNGLIPGKAWVKVQESLERNKSKGYRKPRSNEALLPGLLFCRCGSRMYPKLSRRVTADGKPVPASPGIISVAQPDRSIPPGSNPAVATDRTPPACTASKPGRDGRTGPERVADGLEGTAYVSAEPMAKGDWLQIEFPEPFKGKVSVKSGHQDGTGRLSSGRVEVSSDGKSWSRCGGFSRSSGMCSFQQRTPVRFVRILPEPRIPETVVIREVVVE